MKKVMTISHSTIKYPQQQDFPVHFTGRERCLYEFSKLLILNCYLLLSTRYQRLNDELNDELEHKTITNSHISKGSCSKSAPQHLISCNKRS